MRNLGVVTKVDFINLVKNPIWLFYTAVFPIVLVLILGFLTRGDYGQEVTSYDYYGITMMLFIIFSSAMTAANAFMEDRIKKPNMRIIYAPGAASVIYLSKILATFAFTFICHVVDLLILTTFLKVTIRAWAAVLILFALAELFSVILGIMMCCLLKTEEMTNQIISVVVPTIAVMGGLLFRLDGYGEIIRRMSLLSPAKWLGNSLFQIIYDGDFSLFLPLVVTLSVGSLIMLGICQCTFKKEDCIC